jgi:hypothetical protein
MLRAIFCTCLLGISAALPMISGCHEKKVTTIERSERIEESEPRMVSPGKEVVE